MFGEMKKEKKSILTSCHSQELLYQWVQRETLHLKQRTGAILQTSENNVIFKRRNLMLKYF